MRLSLPARAEHLSPYPAQHQERPEEEAQQQPLPALSPQRRAWIPDRRCRTLLLHRLRLLLSSEIIEEAIRLGEAHFRLEPGRDRPALWRFGHVAKHRL